MPSYNVEDTFWTAPVGREIKKAGKDAQILAMYLMTNPEASNKIGLYYFSFDKAIRFIAMEYLEAKAAMAQLVACQFCDFDDETGMLFIPLMACEQIGYSLKFNDNRIYSVHKTLNEFPKEDRLVKAFIEFHSERFHIPTEVSPKPNLKVTDFMKFKAEFAEKFINSHFIDRTKVNASHPTITQLYEIGVSVEEIVDTAQYIFNSKGGKEQLHPNLVYTSVINNRKSLANLATAKIHKGELPALQIKTPAGFIEPNKNTNYQRNVEEI